MTMGLEIKGIQEAQARNLKWVAALKPSGAFGKAIKDVTVKAHRFLVMITHVDTGSYRASQRMEVKELEGRLFVDPSATNPVSSIRPSLYSISEESRGGEHAAYGRTEAYVKKTLLRNGVRIVRNELT